MDNETPSSLLISAVEAACAAAMQLKTSKKEPFTCLILQVKRDKKAYDIIPVYAPSYETSLETARQHVVGEYDQLFLYIIAADGTVTRDGVSSDAIIIEACEVGQGVRFDFVRRYTPPRLFSKARADKQLTLVRNHPERIPSPSTAKPDDSEDSRAFIEKLAPSYIWILAVGIRGTPAIPLVYDPGALDTIAAHRKDLADLDEDDSVFPFNYDHGGQQILPFFTSEDCARQFIARKNWGGTSPFQPYRLLAGFVTAPGNENFVLILDPELQSERRLQPHEQTMLRKLTSPG